MRSHASSSEIMRLIQAPKFFIHYIKVLAVSLIPTLHVCHQKFHPFHLIAEGQETRSLLISASPSLWPYQVYRRADTHLAKVDCKDSVGAGTLDIHLGAGCGSGESSLFQALDQLQ